MTTTQTASQIARQLRKAGYSETMIYGADARRYLTARDRDGRLAEATAFAERVTAQLPAGLVYLSNGALFSNADADWTQNVNAIVYAAQEAAYAA